MLTSYRSLLSCMPRVHAGRAERERRRGREEGRKGERGKGREEIKRNYAILLLNAY